MLRHYLILQFTSLSILNQSLYLTCTLFILGPQVAKAVEVTAARPRVHGAPIHVGNPASLGIKDLSHPGHDQRRGAAGLLTLWGDPAKRDHAK
ncbi:DUF1445 domain-containing protein [Limosilactobacillus fermentum]|uniref:D-glutamate cyclase family protein n=1 Tax=Limosilactobacillus fermentum TaxID=1613 RepID=UPI003F678C93